MKFNLLLLIFLFIVSISNAQTIDDDIKVHNTEIDISGQDRSKERINIATRTFNKKVFADGFKSQFLFFFHCIFNEKADFRNNECYYINFQNTIFKDDVYFDNSVFGEYGGGVFQMDGAHFYGNASFRKVNISGSDVTLSGVFSDTPTIFEKEVIFDGTEFGSSICFENAIFKGNASFKNVTFVSACFTDSNFNSTLDLSEAEVSSDLYLNRITLRGKVKLDGIVLDGIVLDDLKTESLIDLTTIAKNKPAISLHFTDLSEHELKFDYNNFQLRYFDNDSLEQIEEIYKRTIAIQKFYNFNEGLKKAKNELKNIKKTYQLYDEGRSLMSNNNKQEAHEKFEEASKYIQNDALRYYADYNVNWVVSDFSIYPKIYYYDAICLRDLGSLEGALESINKADKMDSFNKEIEWVKKSIEEKIEVNKSTTDNIEKIQSHKVLKGETLFSISRKYNLYYKDIIEWNNLPKSGAINVGQVLTINAPDEDIKVNLLGLHKVRIGETLFSISKKYGISIEELKALNDIKENNIEVGELLKVDE